PEIGFARRRNEERADGSVAVVCTEVSLPAVELCDHTVLALRLKNGAARRSVAQFLRQTEVVGLRDVAEFLTVLAKVIVELLLRPEARACRQRREAEQEYERNAPHRPNHPALRPSTRSK